MMTSGPITFDVGMLASEGEGSPEFSVELRAANRENGDDHQLSDAEWFEEEFQLAGGDTFVADCTWSSGATDPAVADFVRQHGGLRLIGRLKYVPSPGDEDGASYCEIDSAEALE